MPVLNHLRTQRSPSPSPLRLMGLVLLLVFVIETFIMLVLRFVVPWPRGSVAESITDSVALSALMAPALWFMIVKPLRRVFQERGELLKRLFESQEAERNRLARDLHDEIGQHLTAMAVGLRAMQDGTDLTQMRNRAGELLRLTSSSLKEVRCLASGLRAGVLEDFGLQIAIERMCEDFRKAHGLPVKLTVQLTSDRRFGLVLETTVYRLVQESLTNIARHAQARNVEVSLNQEGGQLSLEMRDDGRGFDRAAAGAAIREAGSSLGLRSMRERVELLGGVFEIRTKLGSGTSIRACLPVSEVPAAMKEQT